MEFTFSIDLDFLPIQFNPSLKNLDEGNGWKKKTKRRKEEVTSLL